METKDYNGMKPGGIISIKDPTLARGLFVATFLCTAIYNAVELTFIIFTSFKRRGGLYFNSFLIASWGIPVYCVGMLIKYLELAPRMHPYVAITLMVLGGCAMVTGQSLVLYSRLHLVTCNPVHLRAVLAMIVVDASVFHLLTVVVLFGANGPNPGPWMVPYSLLEKTQVTVFCAQELTIGTVYILHTLSLYRAEADLHGRTVAHMMRHLIWVNVIVVLLDVPILALEYLGAYDVQTSYKGLVYSVKLKLEFTILNNLVDLAHGARSASQRTLVFDDPDARGEPQGPEGPPPHRLGHRHYRRRGSQDDEVALDYIRSPASAAGPAGARWPRLGAGGFRDRMDRWRTKSTPTRIHSSGSATATGGWGHGASTHGASTHAAPSSGDFDTRSTDDPAGLSIIRTTEVVVVGKQDGGNGPGSVAGPDSSRASTAGSGARQPGRSFSSTAQSIQEGV